jgi:hypothetical protein
MSRKSSSRRSQARSQTRSARQRGRTVLTKPAFGSRVSNRPTQAAFDAPERWHEPRSRPEPNVFAQSPGDDYVHAVTVSEVRERIAQLPAWARERFDVVQLSRMTRKRQLFPCYGLQWGRSVYLYPIEASLVETYVQPPGPQQRIEARMYGGTWSEANGVWRLTWTSDTIKDFYLNNILIHEIGHAVDDRNTITRDRERFANWFAVEYGYRKSRLKRT